MKPASEFSEGELADTLGMSKTPVREALGRLALEGFVVPLPRRGYKITALSSEDMTELFEIRGILESAVIEEVIERITDADIEALEALTNQLNDPDKMQTIDGFIAVHHDFHLTLARAHQNRRAIDIAEKQLGEVERYFYLCAHPVEIASQTYASQKAIVRALRQRDLDGAKASVIEHNFKTHSYLLSQMVAPRIRRPKLATSLHA